MAEPLERELRLDVAAALDSIGSLGDAFSTTVAAFETGLDQALQILQNVQIGDVDATPVEQALQGAIDAGTQTPAVIDADASQVTDAIDTSVASADNSIDVLADTGAIPPDIEDAIASADAEVAVTADVSQAQDEIDNLGASEPVTIEVDADTSAAQDEIDQLNESAVSAGGGLDKLTQSATVFSAAAGAAAGDAGGLEGAVGGISASAGIATGALAALATFTGATVKNAVDAETSQRRFNATLGDTAAAVEHLNVGGLDDDIGHLAVTIGSSDEALRDAASRIAELGKSSGASQEEIRQTAENILALSARLAVVNPRLGDAGQIADRLANAFVRGGRSLAPFGIGLTATEIQARALKDTSKDTADQLTIFDKIAAGAAISVGQLGDRLGTDVAAGSQSAQIQLKSIRTTLDEFLESLGRPLIAPVIDVLREAEPVAEQLGRVLSELAQAVLPALDAPLQVLATLLGAVADVLDAIPTPALSAAVAFVSIGLAVSKLAVALSAVEALGILGAALGGLAVPLGIIAGGLAAGAALFHAFGSGADEAGKKAREAADKILGTSPDLNSTASAIDNLSSSIDALISSSDGFNGAAEEIRAAMRSVGLDNRDLEEALTGTNREFVTFAKQVGDAATKTQGFALEGLKAEKALVDQRKALEDTSQARIADLVASEAITGAQSHEAIERTKNTDGTKNYTAALKLATSAAQEHEAALEAQKNALAAQSADWDNLAKSVLAGKTGLEDVAGISERFGVDQNTVTTFINDVTGALDNFVTSATSKLPTVDDAFKTFQSGITDAFKAYGDAVDKAGPKSKEAQQAFIDLTNATDPARLISNIQQQTQAIVDFQTNVATLIQQGFTRAAQFVIQQGPVIGGQLAKDLATGNVQTRAELENTLGNFNIAYSDYESFIRDSGGPAVLSATGEWANNITGTVGPIVNASGRALGGDLMAGVAQGIVEQELAAVTAAQNALRHVAQKGREVVGAHSPATVFIDLGHDIIDGLAIGLTSTRAQQAAEESFKELSSAFSGKIATQLPTFTVAPQVARTAAQGGTQNVTLNANITVNGTSREAAQAAAQEVVDLTADLLFQRGIRAQVRA